MQYFAIVKSAKGRGYDELLVTREVLGGGAGARLVSQEPTGVTFKTFREADKAISEKNRAIAKNR